MPMKIAKLYYIQWRESILWYFYILVEVLKLTTPNPTIATFTIYDIQMKTQISDFLLNRLPRHCLKCCKGFYWIREFLLVLTISLATWGGFQNQPHVTTCDIYKRHCSMQFSFAPAQEPTSLRPRLNQPVSEN